MDDRTRRQLCRQAVAKLVETEQWLLTDTAQAALVSAILPYVQASKAADLQTVQRIVHNYYLDGPMVEQMIPPIGADGQRLWAEWRSYMLSLARSKGLSTEQAEELAQDTFLQTLKALPSFRFGSRLKTYFCGIFINCFRRWARDTRSAQAREATLEPTEEDAQNGPVRELVAADPSPEEQAIERTQNSQIRRLVLQEIHKILSSEDFQILTWYYVEESYSEAGSAKPLKWTDKAIGRRLDMPLNTVTSRRLRAVQRLQKNPHLRAIFNELLD